MMKVLVALFLILLPARAFPAQDADPKDSQVQFFGACKAADLQSGAESPESLQKPFLAAAADTVELLVAHKIVDLWIDERCVAGDRAWVSARWPTLRKNFFVELYWSAEGAIADPVAGAARLCDARLRRLLSPTPPVTRNGNRVLDAAYPAWLDSRIHLLGGAAFGFEQGQCAYSKTALESSFARLPRGNLRVAPAPLSEAELRSAQPLCQEQLKDLKALWQKQVDGCPQCPQDSASFDELVRAARQDRAESELTSYNLDIAAYPILAYLEGPLQSVGTPDEQATMLKRWGAALARLEANAQATLSDIKAVAAQPYSDSLLTGPPLDFLIRYMPVAVNIFLGERTGANKRYCAAAEKLAHDLVFRQKLENDASAGINALALATIFMNPLVGLAVTPVLLPLQIDGYFSAQNQLSQMEHRLFMSVTSQDSLGGSLAQTPIGDLEFEQQLNTILLPTAVGTDLVSVARMAKAARIFKALRSAFRGAVILSPPEASTVAIDRGAMELLEKR